MDEQIIVTRGELIAAFRQWDEQAQAEGWPDRSDPEASADHLISLVRSEQG